MLRRNLATLTLLFWFTPACSASLAKSEAAAPTEPMAYPAADAASAGMARAAAQQPGALSLTPASAPGATKGKEIAGDKRDISTADQLVIYTGFIATQVEQEAFGKTIDAAVDIASAMGGFVSKQDNQTVQLRVPSARFREAMRELEKLGDVQTRTVDAQDVTEEAHDLDVRLQSLKAARKRIEELMQRAANMTEILQIQEQLAKVTAEIDKIEGRLRFLQAHAAMSSIMVALSPKPKTLPLKQVAAPPPPPPRTVALPIDWLGSLGIDRLLRLN